MMISTQLPLWDTQCPNCRSWQLGWAQDWFGLPRRACLECQWNNIPAWNRWCAESNLSSLLAKEKRSQRKHTKTYSVCRERPKTRFENYKSFCMMMRLKWTIEPCYRQQDLLPGTRVWARGRVMTIQKMDVGRDGFLWYMVIYDHDHSGYLSYLQNYQVKGLVYDQPQPERKGE